MRQDAGRVHRRTALRALGLGTALSAVPGLAACTGDESPRSGSPTGSSGEPSVLDLQFEVTDRYRPFALLAPGFEQVDEGPARFRGLRRTDQVPVAPFVAVEIRVGEQPVDGVAAGLTTSGGDQVLATYGPGRGEVSVVVHRQGRDTVVATGWTSVSASFGFAFVLCENQVTAVVDGGEGWRPVVTDRDGVAALVDLRRPEVLSTYRYCSGAATEDGEVALASVRAGPFGYTGLRDPHLVQRADGTPVLRDGRAYLTFTCAGMGFFQQAHFGAFSLDLADPTRLEQVAQLYSRRDGLLLGDHAGQVVLDDDGRTLTGVSSWGDFDGAGVHVRHTAGADDLLRGVHVLETAPLALPTDLSTWDPSFTRIDDRWYVSFVESESQDPFVFHPALAAGPPGASYDRGLELVGADDALQQAEGPILQQVAGRWYVLASDAESASYPVYDLALEQVGTLDAPYDTSNIPHPQVIARPGGGHLMVTFDGTQYGEDVLGYGGHGDVVVMTSR